jgi:hypothetical protein
MMVLASKRMRYLREKLIADLENPAKILAQVALFIKMRYPGCR